VHRILKASDAPCSHLEGASNARCDSHTSQGLVEVVGVPLVLIQTCHNVGEADTRYGGKVTHRHLEPYAGQRTDRADAGLGQACRTSRRGAPLPWPDRGRGCSDATTCSV